MLPLTLEGGFCQGRSGQQVFSCRVTSQSTLRKVPCGSGSRLLLERLPVRPRRENVTRKSFVLLSLDQPGLERRGNSAAKQVTWARAALQAATWLAIIAVGWTFLPGVARAHTAAGPATSPPAVSQGLISFVLHVDKHLSHMIAVYGNTTYAILFGIVFAETGLVLTPFLPGDSLLFACGALAAMGLLRLPLLVSVFIVAAVLGDAVNYAVGNYIGAKALESKLINKEYIEKTESFFRKYGGKTVVLARFVPIVRTFAPFVAGIGSMRYSEFGAYNVGGALLWTFLFVGAGYLFGRLPVVQHNFTLVVLAIVVLSVLPIAFEVLAARKEGRQSKGSPSGQSSACE